MNPLEERENEEEFLENEEIENEVASDEDELMDEEDEELLEALEAEDMDQEADQDMMGDSSQQQVIFEDESIQGFFEHKEPVYSVAINPVDTNIVVSGGGDDTAYVWRRDTGELVQKLDKHSDSVTAVGFSVDGQYVASGGMDGKIKVYKTNPITPHFVFEDGPDEVVWLDWHPVGNVFAVGANDGSVWMYNVPGKKLMNVFYGHNEPVTTGRFTHSGKNIISGSEDGSLIIWNPANASVVHKFSSEDKRFHQEGITSLDINSDDSIIISGSTDSTAKVLHKNGNILGSLQAHSDSVETVGISSAMSMAATGSVDGSICVWDINTLRLRDTFKHEDAVTKLKFVNNSPLITSTSVDCTVKVWDSRSGENVRTWKGHQDAILDFALVGDGKTVVTASDDGCCLVFSMVSPQTDIYYDLNVEALPIDSINSIGILGQESVSTKNTSILGKKNLLPIIYQDDAIFVFSKPSGLATQGGSKVNISVDHLIKEYKSDYCDPKLVHRLDKDTSGLLVVAKNRLVAASLSEAFRNNYISHPNPPFGKIDKPLEKSIVSGQEITILSGSSQSLKPLDSQYSSNYNPSLPNYVSPKSQSATTFYKTIFHGNFKEHTSMSIVELYPSTGRKHQLRVHCASMLSCPIFGDKKYSKPCNILSGEKTNMHLHMAKIKIPLLNSDGTVKLKENKELKILISDPVPQFWNKTLNALNFPFSDFPPIITPKKI
ncbi:putative WD repeat-containing protein [Smittium mucronatum]|uniref:Putative WD repeat-containing protein n=1 Tax=Smittium mucronatum TaxID=133383 RepID=A0A1R0GX25_9FUNG|nr:putative WD repeat-containing protein [Smittium mucronatum]